MRIRGATSWVRTLQARAQQQHELRERLAHDLFPPEPAREPRRLGHLSSPAVATTLVALLATGVLSWSLSQTGAPRLDQALVSPAPPPATSPAPRIIPSQTPAPRPSVLLPPTWETPSGSPLTMTPRPIADESRPPTATPQATRSIVAPPPAVEPPRPTPTKAPTTAPAPSSGSPKPSPTPSQSTTTPPGKSSTVEVHGRDREGTRVRAEDERGLPLFDGILNADQAVHLYSDVVTVYVEDRSKVSVLANQRDYPLPRGEGEITFTVVRDIPALPPWTATQTPRPGKRS